MRFLHKYNLMFSMMGRNIADIDGASAGSDSMVLNCTGSVVVVCNGSQSSSPSMCGSVTYTCTKDGSSSRLRSSEYLKKCVLRQSEHKFKRLHMRRAVSVGLLVTKW